MKPSVIQAECGPNRSAGSDRLSDTLDELIDMIRQRVPGPTPHDLYHHRIRPRRAQLRVHRRHGSPVPDPWELHVISPTDISGVLSPPFFRDDGFRTVVDVREGDWDRPAPDRYLEYSRRKPPGEDESFDERRTVPLTTEQYGFYRSIWAYLRGRKPWEQTPTGRYLAWDRSERVAREKRRDIDRLVASIERTGYHHPGRVVSSPSPTVEHPHYDAVVVNIDRAGNYILEDGKHRLCVAKAMEVPRFPVRVRSRHLEWHSTRAAVAGARKSSDLDEPQRDQLDHPDIRSLVAFESAVG